MARRDSVVVLMEIDLLGKSVDAPKFLGILEKEFDWFVSYTLMLAEKHFEDPESKRIFIAVALIGDYVWDINTIRFEEVVYEKDRTKRRKIAIPSKAVLQNVMKELRAAYEKAKELPPQIKRRLEEAKTGQ
jgi:hypothetical protein